MTEVTSQYIAPETALWKRISWPAVFGGTFVALATELLFAAFGLFIGFTLSSRGGIDTWAKIWYFVTAFVALLIGGWVAARLSVNTTGSGRLHGAVTWGLTTMATFAFAVWLFWGMLSTSIAAIRTVAVTNNTAPTAATEQLQNQAANAINQANQQAPRIAGMLAGDASTLFLVIFGGILCGCVGSLVGGGLGGARTVPPEAAPVARIPVREPNTAAKSAAAS